jgi:predicted MFS family arabinose efflux permease
VKPDSLARSANFRWFWAGQGVSQLGAQFTELALPVVAVTLLGAGEWEMGLLVAASTAAFLVLGLPAGAWVDRMRKRRIMIAADIARALLLATVPVLAVTGALELWHLIVVAGLVGVATLFFDVSYQSYIPLIVDGRQIGEANSKLEATAQVANIGGPGIAGVLLSIVSAPAALLVTGSTYLVSALSLSRVHDSEIPPDRSTRQPLLREIAEGVSFVWHQPLIRRIAATTATTNLFSGIAFTLLPLLVLRDLDLGPAALGVIFSCGAVGGLLGALATPALSRLLGEGTALSVASIAFGVVLLPLPLALAVPELSLVLLATAQFGVGFFVLVYNIIQVTLRQRLCPPRLLGRMNASIRFVVWGVIPLGSLLGGWLGTVLGMSASLWIAVVGTVLGGAFVVFSPLTGMRELPSGLSPETELAARSDAKTQGADGRSER